MSSEPSELEQERARFKAHVDKVKLSALKAVNRTLEPRPPNQNPIPEITTAQARKGLSVTLCVVALLFAVIAVVASVG